MCPAAPFWGERHPSRPAVGRREAWLRDMALGSSQELLTELEFVGVPPRREAHRALEAGNPCTEREGWGACSRGGRQVCGLPGPQVLLHHKVSTALQEAGELQVWAWQQVPRLRAKCMKCAPERTVRASICGYGRRSPCLRLSTRTPQEVPPVQRRSLCKTSHTHSNK